MKSGVNTTTIARALINILRFLLKNSNLASVFVSDVLVDGEDEHEDEEEASTAEEVPEVVSEVRNLYE